MAKQITQTGITFSSYKDSELLPLNSGIKVAGAEGPDTNAGGAVNAVDIDWNGAEVNGEEIHTTGQFLRRGFAENPYSQRLAKPQNCAVLC